MTQEQSPLTEALNKLSPIQRQAVDWQEGACLVLAGPGAGKTRVLTTRIARLLQDSKERKFKILALTFTTKAAAEMRARVESLVPGLTDERTFVGTFHAFCTQILRQHGSHVKIKPDFGILSQREEQEALLAESLKAAIKRGENFSTNDISHLTTIKELKATLVTPERCLQKINDPHLKAVYELYEQSLKAENVMDFESLILETCRLLAMFPAVGARIRQTYPYWMIDEFQDTTPSQYWLLHYLSKDNFKNIFVVADDDQIIYQWAGASYRQIEKLRRDHKPELIQLVENHRCPPEIVATANKLVANNTQRAPEKVPTISSRESPLNAISYKVYENDAEECSAVTEQIIASGKNSWDKTIIIGRTRALLGPFLSQLKSRGVKAVVAQRRDNFISPQFVWLQVCLDQSLRPANKRNFAILVNSANRFCGIEFNPALLIAQAEFVGENFFEFWAKSAVNSSSEIAKKLGGLIQRLAQSRATWKKIAEEAIVLLLETARVAEGSISDVDEDYAAWNTSIREIRSEIGHEPDLPDLVQGIALRSKEPPRESETVTLMTVHSSKGLEFENVYVVGLAEGEMPSWQSCNKGDNSRDMEEERRNCFVAITRTQEKLNLSTAKIYRGRSKEPSRFLKEMSIVED